MMVYIYIILVVCSFFSFFRKQKLIKRTYRSVVFSVIFTSIICSVMSFGVTPTETNIDFEFCKAELSDSERCLKTENSSYYPIDKSLVYRDTITGVSKEIIKRGVPEVGGLWSIECVISKVTKYHMTDEVYESWKANIEE